MIRTRICLCDHAKAVNYYLLWGNFQLSLFIENNMYDGDAVPDLSLGEDFY